MSPSLHDLLPTLFAEDGAAHAAGAIDSASSGAALAARLARAADRGRDVGLVVLNLGAQAPGEARELASVHAAIALQGVRHGRPDAPTLILSGGPVLLEGRSVGAAPFLLTLALALDAHPAIHGYACGGPRDPAHVPGLGVVLAPDTGARARQRQLHAGQMLVSGQALRFFEQLDACRHGDPWVLDDSVLRAMFLSPA
jgi:glycerate 2-kinase